MSVPGIMVHRRRGGIFISVQSQARREGPASSRGSAPRRGDRSAHWPGRRGGRTLPCTTPFSRGHRPRAPGVRWFSTRARFAQFSDVAPTQPDEHHAPADQLEHHATDEVQNYGHVKHPAAHPSSPKLHCIHGRLVPDGRSRKTRQGLDVGEPRRLRAGTG
jgi:hypothetical protein